jgi:hypothetical protein
MSVLETVKIICFFAKTENKVKFYLPYSLICLNWNEFNTSNRFFPVCDFTINIIAILTHESVNGSLGGHLYYWDMPCSQLTIINLQHFNKYKLDLAINVVRLYNRHNIIITA